MKRGIKRKPKLDRINWKVLIACFAAVFFAAFIGSLVTDVKTGGWYESVKPSITPPSYVFPIVWTILFIMIAASMYCSWINSEKKKKKFIALLFGINLLLNTAWSVLFFGMHNALFAFFDLILLWISILALVVYLWNNNRKAAWLLAPYLLWVSFAGVLNYMIAF